MLKNKLLLVLSLVSIFTIKASASTGLVDSNYLETGVSATDLRSPLTSQTVNSVFIDANATVFSDVSIGVTAEDSRIAAQKLDFTNLNVGVPVILHDSLLGGSIDPYVKGVAGWTYERYSTKHFSAFAYQAGPGIELNPFKFLSVGADVLYSVTTSALATHSQKVYDPYATVWLGKNFGVTASYQYSQPLNTALYSLGTVIRF